MASKGRVLVVEDEWFIADDYERVLSSAGYEIAGPVPNVDAALRLIDGGGIDAAVLDIALGDEKSYPVAKRLKSDGVPFVFMTGYTDGDVPEDLHAAPLVGKPTTPAALIGAVSRLIPK